MIKIILSFCLLSIFNSITAQNIQGEWLFKSIRHNVDYDQENLKPIAEGDFMLIEKDGTFKYKLTRIPLEETRKRTNLFSLATQKRCQCRFGRKRRRVLLCA